MFHFRDQKEKLVYWVVSNCNTHSKREDYVGILQHYIPVDVYGKCGTFTCSHKSDCFDNLSEKYKFYLAFENAICPDYVTEKFFRTLRLPIVPIVMGGDNYKGLLPSGTYIDVNDFKSIKALANHLIYLDKNPVSGIIIQVMYHISVLRGLQYIALHSFMKYQSLVVYEHFFTSFGGNDFKCNIPYSKNL